MGTVKEICKRGHPRTPENVNSYNRDCIECNRIRSRERRKTHPEENRNHLYKYLYGITRDQYNEMLAERQGLCDICKKPEAKINEHGNVNLLAVDHCHKTGIVRGLLCHRCNTGLGLFNDDPELLLQAVEYAKRVWRADLNPPAEVER